MYLETEIENDDVSIRIYACYGAWKYYNRVSIPTMLPQYFPSKVTSIPCQDLWKIVLEFLPNSIDPYMNL
jgi:hypothetical protein